MCIFSFRNNFYLSWPAVSQICSLIFWPDTSMILVPNSTPMVWGQSAMTET